MEWITCVIQILITVVFLAGIYVWFGDGTKTLHFSKLSAFRFLDIHILIKRYMALWFINKRKKERANRLAKYNTTGFLECSRPDLESHKTLKDRDSCESVSFHAVDQKGNSVFIKLARTGYRYTELTMQLILPDGSVYVLPDYPDTVIIGSMTQGWIAENLKIDVLEPQLRWRIIYNGMLLDQSQNDLKHIRLNGIFIAASPPSEWPDDWSSQLHANALANAGWRNPQWIKTINSIEYKGFDQWGSLIAQVTIGDNVPDELFLRGLHQNRWGKHESSQFHQIVVFSGVTAQGTMFHFGASKPKNGFTEIQFGQVKQANDYICNIDWMDLDVCSITNLSSGNFMDYKIHFTAGKIKYVFIIKRRMHDMATFYNGEPWNWKNQVYNLRVEVNGSTGLGMMQISSLYNGPCQTKPPTIRNQYLPIFNNNYLDEYILPFDEKSCHNKDLVGGKGSSLAFLTSIKNNDFIVPQGFCITTLAFNAQLQSNKEIQDSIDRIEKICTSKMKGDLREACEKAVHVMQSVKVIEPVAKAIIKGLEDFETIEDMKKLKNIRYAVRSSAVGEDSEDTSAAGQNSTYLSVQGVDNILNSVAMCWSSLYTYQSVEYRRQQGLPIKSSMGVCVQTMANADVAGVLFTRHPTSGDPSSIVITSNFGLGEVKSFISGPYTISNTVITSTVVSADVEPDTIIVHRGRNDELTIKSSTVGKKSHKVSANEKGLEKIVLNDADALKLSISKEIALLLGKIGIYIESLVAGPRDIEFAVVNDEIFLLQCRPITSLDRWTDFELTHELDSGVPTDTDILTFANIGEVLPRPLSPITITTVLKSFNATAGLQRVQNPYGFFCPVSSWRGTVNYSAIIQAASAKVSTMNKIFDMALCGRQVITTEIIETAMKRNHFGEYLRKIQTFFDIIQDCWNNDLNVKKAYEVQTACNLDPNEFQSPQLLYDALRKNFRLLNKITKYHSTASSVSVCYQGIAMSILTEGTSTFTSDHIADMAILLGSCTNAISSQIPHDLRKIAESIKVAGKARDFGEIDPLEGISWLKSNCPNASKLLQTFFNDHGHRSLEECDIRAKAWSQTPENVISMLQALVKSTEGCEVKKMLNTEETIAALKSPKKKFYLYLLKKLVPLCRKTVGKREETKSILIRVTHNFRLAYKRIGELMTMEGLLPDDDLLYFLTHYEIGQLLNNRNPALVRKAMHRRRLYAKLENLQYPEFNEGVPRPIKGTIDTKTLEGCVKIQGTSVCGGSVLARACVITELADAKLIETGDILITRSTDVAWSPYFPLLGGVVTEMGGLISHGAVVAREYGLPCIVGATGATNIFKTGDMVLLVGETGTLQIVDRA